MVGLALTHSQKSIKVTGNQCKASQYNIKLVLISEIGSCFSLRRIFYSDETIPKYFNSSILNSFMLIKPSQLWMCMDPYVFFCVIISI